MPTMRAQSLIGPLIVAEIAYPDIDTHSIRPLPAEEGPFPRCDRLHPLLAVVDLALNFYRRYLFLFLLTGTTDNRLFAFALGNFSAVRLIVTWEEVVTALIVNSFSFLALLRGTASIATVDLLGVFCGLFESGALSSHLFLVLFGLLVGKFWREEMVLTMSLFSERGSRAMYLETVGLIGGRLSFHWPYFWPVTTFSTRRKHLWPCWLLACISLEVIVTALPCSSKSDSKRRVLSALLLHQNFRAVSVNRILIQWASEVLLT